MKENEEVLSREEMQKIIGGQADYYYLFSCQGGNTVWYACDKATDQCTYSHTTSGCLA